MLDAVGDGVANEMYKRIGNLLNDVVVELGFVSGEVQLDELAGRSGGLAHGALQAPIQRAYGHHAPLREFVLKVIPEPGALVHVALDAASSRFRFGQSILDARGNIPHSA